jgi:hypothetical protein
MNACNGFMLGRDTAGVLTIARSVVGRARRVTRVAEQIIDHDDDPLFRNGLLVFVKELHKGTVMVNWFVKVLVVNWFVKELHKGTLVVNWFVKTYIRVCLW